MLEKQMKEFEKYYKKFDTENENILRKYDHSIRVMNFSIQIAKSLNLSKKMIEIIGIAGLLHDIGRFEQWTKYKTYSDYDSIDHANLGVDILKEDNYIKKYINEDKYISFTLKAVFYHNKSKISDNLSLDEEIVCKVVRDADKLDIIQTQCKSITTTDNFSKEMLDNIYKRQLCSNITIKNEADQIIRQICFIYDICFQYSLEYIKNNNILNNKLDILKNNTADDVSLLEVKNYLNQYLNDKIRLVGEMGHPSSYCTKL